MREGWEASDWAPGWVTQAKMIDTCGEGGSGGDDSGTGAGGGGLCSSIQQHPQGSQDVLITRCKSRSCSQG